ncbi:MAG: LOG family protein [Chlamydiales bacterium]
MHLSTTEVSLTHYDLVTPDGLITELTPSDDKTAEAIVFIENISPLFVGFEIDNEKIFFNLKSTLAQLGLNSKTLEIELDQKNLCAEVKVFLTTIGPIAEAMLPLLPIGAKIGKLFAADDRRRVRDPYYLSRMFGRADREGNPLLSLGGLHGSTDLILDVVDGRTVAYLSLQNGRFVYEPTIMGFLPTIAKTLTTNFSIRELLRLHQEWKPNLPRNAAKDEILLVRTLPLHIRTVFGYVVEELLSEGYHHTSASILQPNTEGSGDIYELYGESKREISDIPLEFYTLEPYREYVFFSDRDQLQTCLENPQTLFNAFETAPKPDEDRAAVFIAKGTQLLNLQESDWIVRETHFHDFPGSSHPPRQALMIQRYIEQQPDYPYLKAISEGLITSQGVLLARYFPSPLMKRMLLSYHVQDCLRGIYFQYPSKSHDDYFSGEDRTLLHDLYKFAIPVYWVDKNSGKILRYVEKPNLDTGLFVPIDQVEKYLTSTVFGIYGSNLLTGDFETELRALLKGILKMRKEMNHPQLGPETPLSLVTGGGPGVMEMGNKIAQELGILSCANIVDFRIKEGVVNEQRQNPYIEAKMTYRLDKLVERQAEFNLDFPIFLVGGIGTDFEHSLEEVRRKVGSAGATPIILFGEPEYWRQKITTRFTCNLENGTIKGSEWVSNCFYCVTSAEEGLEVFKRYFNRTLPIGKKGPIYPAGFVESLSHISD